MKYLGHYLMKPPAGVSFTPASLRRRRGDPSLYLDHRTGKHKRHTLSQEEMFGRSLSHVPSRHFKKMVRYSRFLANRKRGTLLTLVYEALQMQAQKKPENLGFAVLMKGFLGTDPYKCILYGDRLRFAGAQAGTHATELLSERLQGMEKKRWLLMPSLDQRT
ncbi:MAG: hypothetical protein G5701_09850 [Serratia symbiotica]|nr:hypothetical protein [Serratia symbiotica]